MKLKPGETIVFWESLQIEGAPRSCQRQDHTDDEGDESADGHALRHEADDLHRIQSHRLELTGPESIGSESVDLCLHIELVPMCPEYRVTYLLGKDI